jgi:hypothetical protein
LRGERCKCEEEGEGLRRWERNLELSSDIDPDREADALDDNVRVDDASDTMEPPNSVCR